MLVTFTCIITIIDNCYDLIPRIEFRPISDFNLLFFFYNYNSVVNVELTFS